MDQAHPISTNEVKNCNPPMASCVLDTAVYDVAAKDAIMVPNPGRIKFTNATIYATIFETFGTSDT